MHPLAFICIGLLGLGLSGCGPKSDGPPLFSKHAFLIADAVPRIEPKSKRGNNPYTVFGKRYFPMQSAHGYHAEGTASWYGTKFHGRETSSGEPYDLHAMTAAHKTLPLPTYLKVTNLENKRTVIVRVNDRGPFHGDRILDLSYAAAKKLGFAHHGTAPIRIEAIDPKTFARRKQAPERNLLPALRPLYIQLGAFETQTYAEHLADKLAHLGNIQITAQANYYKVLLGPLPNRHLAEKLKAQCMSAGYTSAHIISLR